MAQVIAKSPPQDDCPFPAADLFTLPHFPARCANPLRQGSTCAIPNRTRHRASAPSNTGNRGEIEAETYLPIRAEQGLHTDVTPEITSCRAILPPVEASTEDVPAKPANVFVCIHLLMKLWGGGRPPRYLFYIIFTRHRQPPDRRRISPTPCLRLIPCPPRCPSYCMAHLVFRARPVPAKGMLRCRGRSRPRNN